MVKLSHSPADPNAEFSMQLTAEPGSHDSAQLKEAEEVNIWLFND